MQQNQDNLINENPYSPPKSEDFRQPENSNYQPTKGQRIGRIVLSSIVFALSELVAYFVISLIAVIIFFVFKKIDFSTVILVLSQLNSSYNILNKMFIIYGIMFLVVILFGIVFFIFTEYYYFQKMKNKYVYIIKSSFLFIMLEFIIFMPIISVFYYHSFDFSLYLNRIIEKDLYKLILTVLSVNIALWISLFVFEKHRKYYAKKSIQAA